MGRELKRVPLDFDHPLNKTWEGYVYPNPDLNASCTECDGTGYTKEALAVDIGTSSARFEICEQLGVEWECPACEGYGEMSSEEQQKAEGAAFEYWSSNVRHDPPTGEGYQMWETVSEGSPITPVFATPDELASWIASSRHERDSWDYEEALNWVTGPGWSPTYVIDRQSNGSPSVAVKEKEFLNLLFGHREFGFFAC